MEPFIAKIIPISAGEPTHPIAPGGPPPTVWPSPGHPAHPIAPGGEPPHPEHPIVLPIPPDAIRPGVPAHPIYIPIYPAHPIIIPPDAIAPGVPTHPIVLPPVIWPSPGHPAHPIVLPPDSISPGVPAHPIFLPPTIWPPAGHPEHPIVLPPGSPVPPGADVIWPPPGPLTGVENPITIVPPGKVMVYIEGGWVIVDQPAATPGGGQPPKK